jgi:hypothetical protein
MFGASAIHAAHFTGQADLAARFRAAGADVGFVVFELGSDDEVRAALTTDPGLATRFDQQGSTALHGAVYWGQLRAAERLLEAGADVTVATRDEFLEISTLGSAVATTPGIAQPSDDEDTVLALVRLLLERGADPNHRRRDGSTPLHAAAWRGLDRVCQELLDAGADRSVVGHGGETPADTALSQGHLVLAAALDSGVAEVASPYG